MTMDYPDGAHELQHEGRRFILKRDKRRRWRAYFRDVVHTYDGSNFGQGGGIHYRDTALRSAINGQPLAPLPDREQMATAVLAALAADDVLPWG